jgi:hypothetical protein
METVRKISTGRCPRCGSVRDERTERCSSEKCQEKYPFKWWVV